MIKQVDIIIVGGGIVGAALACLLAEQTSLSIALLETNTDIIEWNAASYHHRVSAITLASKRLFERLNIWQDIKSARVSPFTRIEVWDHLQAAQLSFDCRDIAEPVLGYIIENNLLQAVLNKKIKTYPHLTLCSGKTLTTVQEDENYLCLTTEDHEIWQARLAIAADGANSHLRKLMRFEMNEFDYDEAAIVATIETALPHLNTARQAFLAAGPLGFLPLAAPHTSSIVWSLPKKEAENKMTLSPHHFKTELTNVFSGRLGDVLTLGERYTFPLRKQEVKRYIKSRVALVGDAAHTIHPLAGQGVNMGLLDAGSLAEVITHAHYANRDFASLATLRRYERWRKADNFSLMRGIDFIKHVFTQQQASLQHLRAIGVNTLDGIRWMKNIFTRHAVGNRKGLPSLISSDKSVC